MITRQTVYHAAIFLLIAGCCHRSQAQESPVIRTESRVVLVDAVVTDKKGNYVRDLKQKDFKVWEDNKEQTITSFTFEADAASPANDRKHYLVLFFDNSTSSPQDQIRAREAAAKFIDANAGKNRLMAVVEFSAGLRVTQNFTDDADRLKKVVAGVKFSSLSPNQGPAVLRSFSSRSVLLALRDLSKGLSTVPGRKTLVFISAGFPLDSEGYTELTATIDACNRANVAVYPIDVHGLAAPGSAAGPRGSLVFPGLDTSAFLLPASFQSKGGRGGGGSSSRNPAPPPMNPNAGPRTVMPPLGGVGNQQVLYALATGTGGFVIVNTNDLLSGMEKIGKEQNEFYLLGYTPSKELAPGACHTIKVKVDQGGDMVRARSGYCDVKPKDILAGTPTERDLENRAKGTAAPSIKASMQAPFLYISPGVARVDMAMDVPAGAMSLAKEKGKFQVSMSVIGIVSLPDGGVAARFSDQVKREFEEKKQAEAFQQRPYHYQKQFEVASGTYNLKVVFSAGGDTFGKLEAPLVVDPYEGKQFIVSGLVLSKDAHAAGTGGLGAAAAALEDRVPLMVNNVEIMPAGTNHFSKAEKGFVYGEIYEPAFLADEITNPPAVGIQMQMIERKTGAVKFDSGVIRLNTKPQPGVAAVPFALKLDFSAMAEGSYQVRLTALDSTDHKFTRTTDLELDGN